MGIGAGMGMGAGGGSRGMDVGGGVGRADPLICLVQFSLVARSTWAWA